MNKKSLSGNIPGNMLRYRQQICLQGEEQVIGSSRSKFRIMQVPAKLLLRLVCFRKLAPALLESGGQHN